MALYPVLGLVGLVLALMAYDDAIRMRGFHLGMCGVFKVNTMGLGKPAHATLADMSDFFPDVPLDTKMKVAVPLNVNEDVRVGKTGLWLDPCQGTRYGCEAEGRPAMLFLPGHDITTHAYAGPAALVARTANASVLICGGQSVEDSVECYNEVVGSDAFKGKLVIVGSAEGAVVLLGLHAALAGKGNRAQAYWLITPKVAGAAAAEVKDLPPTFVTFSTDEAVESYLASAVPSAELDLAVDFDRVMPLEFPLLADWLPRGLVSLARAKAFFSKVLETA
eukprot:TRINITY_DN23836_c0_g1_i1.p1 TRINITY_DN23836_c0_g1~~TRINITY_DN23836_c0_g1_i1.p1  ORF type:complete len:299 (+),score=105.45 TRINITY_DN23836_c0_g1_i1:64-897(+)